ESMPLMIPFMNHATQQDWTCPITMLGTKLAQLVDKAGDRLDLDFLEYAHANLGKGVTIKNPSIQFTGLKSLINGRINGKGGIKKELAHKYEVMELAALIEKADAYQKQPSAKHAEWRLMIGTIADRKDKLECVEILFNAME